LKIIRYITVYFSHRRR